MSPILSMSELNKSFVQGMSETLALRGINFSVSAGEFVAVTGPSGAGKSTLLNIAGLLDVADSGTYLLDGKDVSRLKERELARLRNQCLGYVFQNANLIPELNVFDNLDLPLRYRAMPARQRRTRINDVLSQLGLSSRKHHFPSQLSGGQRQRVAIARAVVTEPKLILADEPTGSLDSLMARQVMDMLESLNASGIAVVLVTHDHELARRAHRQIHIVDGRLLDDPVQGVMLNEALVSADLTL
ncbi:ABC transporter ATP-binding protein [Agaribacterium sp. ZY112]|uniref:ABC transporter ATP-binding protein n=1 Tax=Agaribacterium sp. ZY112 TaxID=3233574 RepID=UPI0035264C42